MSTTRKAVIALLLMWTVILSADRARADTKPTQETNTLFTYGVKVYEDGSGYTIYNNTFCIPRAICSDGEDYVLQAPYIAHVIYHLKMQDGNF